MRGASTAAAGRGALFVGAKRGSFFVIDLAVVIEVEFKERRLGLFELLFGERAVGIGVDGRHQFGWRRRWRIVFRVLFFSASFTGWFGTELLFAECTVLVFIEFEEGFARLADLAGGELVVVIPVDGHGDDVRRWRRHLGMGV